MQKDYGELRLVPITCDRDFWSLVSALQEDEKPFLNNLNTIVEQYRNNNLYGLRVTETEEMYERGACQDPVFCRYMDGTHSLYLLPCFCMKVGNTAELLWVHSKARRMCLGKRLVKLLNIQFAYVVDKESMPFWNACNVLPVTSLPRP